MIDAEEAENSKLTERNKELEIKLMGPDVAYVQSEYKYNDAFTCVDETSRNDFLVNP